jgi:cellulose synthase/poly-beta-1,6-N-acetylglucosamine synthase-like glycosyltransferase
MKFRFWFSLALVALAAITMTAEREVVALPVHRPEPDAAPRAVTGRLSTSLVVRRWLIIGLVTAVLGAITVLVHRETTDPVMIAYWYFGASIILFCLIAFVVGRRYLDNPVAPGKVLCIVPAYNEDPAGLKATVLALLNQTVPLDIIVMDDGSASPVIPSIHDPRVTWLRQENTGKRGAQVAVLRDIDPDEYQFILTVDSDSEPYPDACEHLLRAMSNPKVWAATGMIYIRNFKQSWVAFGADLDIGTSCVMMRASRSMLGALETTSGALALYRSELLFEHLDAYAVECGTGDDRWLALRALRRGQVVAVAEAGVETDMPHTLKGTYKQRLRWSRSWWWMLPYVGKYLGPKQFISPMYGVIQLFVTPMMLLYIVGATTATEIEGHGRYGAGRYWVVVAYVAAYLVVRYGLAALYLMGRPNVPLRWKLVLFLFGTPAAVVLNAILLVPTRYIALTKLFDNRWQTRELSAAQIKHLASASQAHAVHQTVTAYQPDVSG